MLINEKKKLNGRSDFENVKDSLDNLICISTHDNNNRVLIDLGAVELVLPFVFSSEADIWKKGVHLLSNICMIESVEHRNKIIDGGTPPKATSNITISTTEYLTV
jgi:hypothetical protein